jgi:hypothetical protein
MLFNRDAPPAETGNWGPLMPFEIKNADKYACIALENVGTVAGLTDPIDLGDGFWALLAPPFPLDATWRAWLGSLQSQDFERSNLFLFAIAPSKSPQVMDAENEALSKRVLALFYGLFLHDVAFCEGGLALSGAKVEGRIDVRRVSKLEPFYCPPGVRWARIDEPWLRSARAAAIGIQSVHAAKGQYERLRRGFYAWLRAWMEYYGDEKLHQSVRAVEAVIKTEQGRSLRLFVHRGQVFAGNNWKARTLLKELYLLRNAAEHMNPFQPVLAKYAPDIDAVAPLRVYQGLKLANVVYSRILTNPKLQQTFASDASTEAFWQQPWADQVKVWGPPVDIEATTSPRFNRDLL